MKAKTFEISPSGRKISLKEKVHRTAWEKAAIGICLTIFCLYAVSLIYPFLWMTLNAFKTKTEFYEDVFALPQKWQFINFLQRRGELQDHRRFGRGDEIRQPHTDVRHVDILNDRRYRARNIRFCVHGVHNGEV